MKLNKTWQAVIAVVINVIIFVAFWRNYVWLSFAFPKYTIFYFFLIPYVLLLLGILGSTLLKRKSSRKISTFSLAFLVSGVLLVLIDVDIYSTQILNWNFLLALTGFPVNGL
jgi:hypothetical protein